MIPNKNSIKTEENKQKIWIIHNSKYGNSEKVANQIAKELTDNYDIHIEKITNLSPEDIAKDEPHGLIIAFRIISYSADSKVREFLNNLDKAMSKPIPKVAYFATHSWAWKNSSMKGAIKTLENMACVEDVCSKFLKITVIKNKGPLAEDSDAKINEYVSTLREFMM